MGIKHFFKWFKDNFSDEIHRMVKGQTFADVRTDLDDEKDNGIQVDNFMIDLNGIFHHSAQEVYKYGVFKPPRRYLSGRKPRPQNGFRQQIKFFESVCASIEQNYNIVKPKKRLILCVDGPAPLSKQKQQRQRRFVSASAKTEEECKNSFDSNCLTPGTKIMNYLTKYIDWWIRKKMSEDEEWSKIDVIFSNEKVPGEGEHKIINFIRKFGTEEESYCIHGMDADLIMLSLGTHKQNFWILREEPRDPKVDFYAINIGAVRMRLTDMLYWSSKKDKHFVRESAINDFIFMCFIVGNDFLPHIPGVEIIEGGIKTMIDVYKQVCEVCGHITKKGKKGLRFSKKTLGVFLITLSQFVKTTLEDKLLHKDKFSPDKILEQNAHQDNDGTYEIDMEQYRADYYSTNLPDAKDQEKLCHDYLEGMFWVLTYYTSGVPDWKWKYDHHYAPFCLDLGKNIKTFKFPEYGFTVPTVPFIQLLSVLPPKSSKLLPPPLDKLLIDKHSPIKQFCPDDFDVDLSGTRQDWEGVVLLPQIDYKIVEDAYFEVLNKVDPRERARNILGKSFIYKKVDYKYNFRSESYGNFSCSVDRNVVEL